MLIGLLVLLVCLLAGESVTCLSILPVLVSLWR